MVTEGSATSGQSKNKQGRERVSTGVRCEPHLPVKSDCLETDVYGWSQGTGKDELTEG